MDHEQSLFPTGRALELRVLSGPQAGACAALPSSAACVLAGAADEEAGAADIVLRDEGAAALRMRITAMGEQALVEVLRGRVTLGDMALEAGQASAWAMHAPLQVGSSTLAFGAAGDEAWPAPQAAPQEAAEPAPQRRGAAWLLPLGVALAFGCLGLLGFVHVVSAQRPAAVAAPSLADALRGSEFSALTLATDSAGREELRGRLGTLAQRIRLDAWLAARQASPLLDVQVDEAIARDVTDVFRVNGVAVQARVQGPGQIAVDAAEPDAGRLARAEEVVRRDVHGLDKLSLLNKAAPAPPPAPPVVDDPGKRIASLVPGDPPYLVTVDGARYFVGAMLPSGHRITQIAGQRVTLERDGQTTALNL